MSLKNKKNLNEAFVQHEGVVCLAEGNISYLNDNEWDIYNILSWEGGSQFVSYASNTNAMKTYFPAGQASFTDNINEETKLLFIVSANTNEVAGAIVTNMPSNIRVISYDCQDADYNCNFSIEYAPNFTHDEGINEFNLYLPSNLGINLKFSDINNDKGIVIKGNKFKGISFAFRDPNFEDSIDIPEGITELSSRCLNSKIFSNYSIKIPTSVYKINRVVDNLANLKGATFSFSLTEEQVCNLETEDDFLNILLNNDVNVEIEFKDDYDTEDDFKAAIIPDLENLKSERILKTLKIELNNILKKCFKYYKTEDENSLPEDIKTNLNQIKEIISKKEYLEEILNQNKFAFKINGNEAWVVDCFDTQSDTLIIPETYKGKLVTRLEKYSLYRESQLDTVVLPKGITFLGKNCINKIKCIKTVADPKNIVCTPSSINMINHRVIKNDFEIATEFRYINKVTLDILAKKANFNYLTSLSHISQAEYNDLSQGGNN